MKLKINVLYINKDGQIMILAIMTLPLLLMLSYSTLFFSRFIERKIALQNGTDAALLSGTEMLAEGLNRIRSLNQRLKKCHALLLLAQAGEMITGNGGFFLSEKTLRGMIEVIAKEQDMIKNITPFLASQKIFTLAQKNHVHHFLLIPPLLYYSIERLPPQNNLPNIYQLKSNFYSSNTWTMHGYSYRKNIEAKASLKLKGNDLLVSHWKGEFIE